MATIFTYMIKTHNGQLKYADAACAADAIRQLNLSEADVRRHMPIKSLAKTQMDESAKQRLRNLQEERKRSTMEEGKAKATPKPRVAKEKKTKEPQKPSIKELVFGAIKKHGDKLTYEYVEKLVKETHPKSKFSKTHLSWYRSKFAQVKA